MFVYTNSSKLIIETTMMLEKKNYNIKKINEIIIGEFECGMWFKHLNLMLIFRMH